MIYNNIFTESNFPEYVKMSKKHYYYYFETFERVPWFPIELILIEVLWHVSYVPFVLLFLNMADVYPTRMLLMFLQIQLRSVAYTIFTRISKCFEPNKCFGCGVQRKASNKTVLKVSKTFEI